MQSPGDRGAGDRQPCGLADATTFSLQEGGWPDLVTWLVLLDPPLDRELHNPEIESVSRLRHAPPGELEAYLLEYSRRERVALLSRPRVTFETDEQLGLGEFGIQARLVRPTDDRSAEPD